MRRTRVVTAIGALGLLVVPCTVRAQSVPFRLPVGERVMLQYKDTVRLVSIGFNRHRLVGVLLSDTGGTYRLRLPTGDSLAVRQTAVTGAWRTLGVSRARSAFVSGVTLAATGALTAMPRDPRTRDRVIGAAIGAGVGTALGLIRPYELWRRVRR